MADEKKVKETDAGSHRATERGYAGGEIIEPQRLVPAGTPVSENWMEPVKKGDEKLARAVEEAGMARPIDPDLTKLNKTVLQTMAVERGVASVEGLTREDLITAIRSSYDHDRTQ